MQGCVEYKTSWNPNSIIQLINYALVNDYDNINGEDTSVL